jgi:hypothetical protein
MPWRDAMMLPTTIHAGAAQPALFTRMLPRYCRRRRHAAAVDPCLIFILFSSLSDCYAAFADMPYATLMPAPSVCWLRAAMLCAARAQRDARREHVAARRALLKRT